MELIRNTFHPTWELRTVGQQRALGATPGGPAIVEDDIVVTQVAKTKVDNLLGGREEEGFVDVAAEGVPVILGKKQRLAGLDEKE